MNQKRIWLYLGFALYQIAAFIFTIMVDGHLDLLGLLKFIPWFKFITFFGLILFIADVIWYVMDRRANRRKQDELEKENTVLKSKIYDYQEAAKGSSSKV
ncbi:MAG TPA: hypothetical protein PLR06_07525 [Cyclobacteriaceae bacterium]|nr:hypothetical protein [Cyclobacteriaceae bacterium]